jgi:hypothetical protein
MEKVCSIIFKKDGKTYEEKGATSETIPLNKHAQSPLKLLLLK